MVNCVRIDRLVKYVYLTLTKDEFPTFPSLINSVLWGVKNCMGTSVQYRYFGILVLDSCVGILDIVLVN